MRVRRFELRLLGVALVACWSIAAGLVLLAYRPGGPLDIVVGIVAMLPIAIAVAGVVWPPVARGDLAFPVIVWVGIIALLFLVPSIIGVVNQLVALGSQTLLPSFEAAYPWLIALSATSLFTGFGVARRLEREESVRHHRVLAGIVFGVLATIGATTAFAAIAVANDEAVRTAGPTTSRFGPTAGDVQPPRCDAQLTAGRNAHLAMRLTASADLRPIGNVDVSGLRSGDDFRWLAYVASSRQLGQYGSAEVGAGAWTLAPGSRWKATRASEVADDTIDLQALDVALTPGYRATAEDRGVEVIEGARARRCRIAVDGPVFRAAFPQARFLVGDDDLHRWRGQLDYWVFLDGQLGQIAGSVNGEGADVAEKAIQGTIDVHLTATERGRNTVIYPPAP
jgi:hypothetical protein